MAKPPRANTWQWIRYCSWWERQTATADGEIAMQQWYRQRRASRHCGHPKSSLGLAISLLHDYLAIGGLPFSPTAVASPLPRLCARDDFVIIVGVLHGFYVVKQSYVEICFKRAPFLKISLKKKLYQDNWPADEFWETGNQLSFPISLYCYVWKW